MQCVTALGGMRAGECEGGRPPHFQPPHNVPPLSTFQAEAIIEALDRQASMRWVHWSRGGGGGVKGLFPMLGTHEMGQGGLRLRPGSLKQ